MKNFNFKNPDYVAVFKERHTRLQAIREDPAKNVAFLKTYYKEHPAEFINDWGVTFDPRNVERKLPSIIPFILFDRQLELVDWVMERWKNQEPGLVDKSRDMGISWLTMALACTLCLFNDGIVIGFGSRKEEYVDKIGSPKCLFHKARMFMQYLPKEFIGSWDVSKNSPHMRILFPDTQSIISGESGDGIGRGDRTSIYFVDEAAFLQRPQLTENSLSQTTNCRIDVSTHNGSATIFNEKIIRGNINLFEFDWSEDPRKDKAWLDKQIRELDPVSVEQEILRNPNASIEGVMIPAIWVDAAMDAHITLGIEKTGKKLLAFDVADKGKDKCATCGAHGIVIEQLAEWSGVDEDILYSVQKTFGYCDDFGYKHFYYDADGVGSGRDGIARILNDQRLADGRNKITVSAFIGQGALAFPNGQMVSGRKNKDYFANLKAQGWWHLRTLFQNTFRAINEKGFEFDPDEIISISSSLDTRLRLKLVRELSQVTYKPNTAGKIVVDKAPEGTKSPNLADSVMMRFAQQLGSRQRRVMVIDGNPTA